MISRRQSDAPNTIGYNASYLPTNRSFAKRLVPTLNRTGRVSTSVENMYPPIAICLFTQASALAYYAGCYFYYSIEQPFDGRKQQSVKFGTRSSRCVSSTFARS